MNVKVIVHVYTVTLEAFEHVFATDYGNPRSEVSDPLGTNSYC